MKINTEVSDQNNEIHITNMSNEEFDKLRIVFQTLHNYGDVFKNTNLDQIGLQEIINQLGKQK